MGCGPGGRNGGRLTGWEKKFSQGSLQDEALPSALDEMAIVR